MGYRIFEEMSIFRVGTFIVEMGTLFYLVKILPKHLFHHKKIHTHFSISPMKKHISYGAIIVLTLLAISASTALVFSTDLIKKSIDTINALTKNNTSLQETVQNTNNHAWVITTSPNKETVATYTDAQEHSSILLTFTLPTASEGIFSGNPSIGSEKGNAPQFTYTFPHAATQENGDTETWVLRAWAEQNADASTRQDCGANPIIRNAESGQRAIGGLLFGFSDFYDAPNEPGYTTEYHALLDGTCYHITTYADWLYGHGQEDFSQLLKQFSFTRTYINGGKENLSVAENAYTDTTYGFSLSLPASWSGYSVEKENTWEGTLLDPSPTNIALSGPEIIIEHPNMSGTGQRIPIMVFTLDQWEQITAENLAVSAAPIPPSELGRTTRYVFALPPRYNYGFDTPEHMNEADLYIIPSFTAITQ